MRGSIMQTRSLEQNPITRDLRNRCAPLTAHKTLTENRKKPTREELQAAIT
jgi:hypothetical protein